ncbi:hypothetical protein [Nonomuraea sp. NPDC050786]
MRTDPHRSAAGTDPATSLAIARRVSASLVGVVRGVTQARAPRFIV